MRQHIPPPSCCPFILFFLANDCMTRHARPSSSSTVLFFLFFRYFSVRMRQLDSFPINLSGVDLLHLVWPNGGAWPRSRGAQGMVARRPAWRVGCGDPAACKVSANELLARSSRRLERLIPTTSARRPEQFLRHVYPQICAALASACLSLCLMVARSKSARGECGSR